MIIHHLINSSKNRMANGECMVFDYAGYQMNRYLINLSYVGTHFRGIQKNLIKANGRQDDPYSVEGALEIALKKFRPVNEFKIKLSSRSVAW